MHAQVNDPAVFVQVALLLQLSVLAVHSLMLAQAVALPPPLKPPVQVHV